MGGSINTPYVYTPLKFGEARLLYHYKDTGWHLEIVQLEPSPNIAAGVPEFDALSYTWAERRSTRPIWVDAICINQLDESEKLTQIRLMHRIYRQASTVWACLGCATNTEHSEVAIALLPHLGQVGRLLDQQPLPRWTTARRTPESMGLPGYSSPIWGHIQRIVCNDWFRRVWAVQEFALAKDVTFLYGSHKIHTAVIEDAVVFGHRLEALRDTRGLKLPTGIVADSRGMVRIRRLIANERLNSINANRSIPNHLLGTLVYMTESHEFSEPRDRILGILGFLEGYAATELAVRLSNDTSIVNLYTKFSHYLLTHGDQSQIHWWKLLDRGTLLGKRAGLPSWCADFHQRQNENARNSICRLGAKSELPYRANHSQGSIRRGGSSWELVIRGVIFDHIEFVHPITPFPPITIQEFTFEVYDLSASNLNTWMSFLVELRTFLDAVVASTPNAGHSSTYPNCTDGNRSSNGKVLDTYWRTLIGNTTRQEDYTVTRDTFESFLNTLSALEDTQQIFSVLTPWEKAARQMEKRRNSYKS
ncbi:heterokaryon incompatibility protein-domain-containing protein [Xylaria grammica]|nr:heterokaryon incompatibility protein-domain-containing protein [Xylaria grammica]